jgi:tetratricopeptide (TPR) repeat protein
MRRKFNVKFFAAFVLVTACLMAGVHFLHAYQIKRNAASLLEQASQAEEQDRLSDASELLGNYLAFVPNDKDVLARYGLLLERRSDSAKSIGEKIRTRIQAFIVLEKASRLAPERQDLHRKLAQVAMDLGRFNDAQTHLQVLLKAAPNDGELEHLLGQCYEGGAEYSQAADWYKKAVQHSPQHVESYEHLAAVTRRHLGKPDEAEQVMNELIAKNPKSFQAYLARARFWQELKSPEKAKPDIVEAQKLAPDDAAVIIAVSALARENAAQSTDKQKEQYLNEARKCLNRGLELHPQNADMFLALAQVELAANRTREARECLERGLSVLPDQSTLLWALANLRIDQGEAPQEQIDRLQAQGVSPAEIDYLNARIALLQENWLYAVQTLERTRPVAAKSSDLAKQIDLYLGQGYRQLGDVDQAYGAYRRALAEDPSWLPASLGAASALVSMGRLDDAIEAYRKIIPQAPGARLEVVRLLIIRNLRLPEAQRRWEEIDYILDKAANAAPELPDVPILQAESMWAQDKKFKKEQVLEHLTKARDKSPKQVQLWVALAELNDRLEKTGAALTVLDEAQKQLGDKVELRLARANYWAKREGAAAKEALAKLETNMGSFSDKELAMLLRGLASAYRRFGDLPKAIECWTRVVDKHKNDLDARLALFDLALEAGNEEAMKRWVEEIHDIEGDDGTLWRYGRACQLIWQAKKTKNLELLEQARGLLVEVAARRPAWSRIALCQARIDDLRQQDSSAIKNYLQAIELGERAPEVIRRTAQLLYQKQRISEADDVLQKLPEQSMLSGDLQRLAAQISLEKQDFDRALALAQRAVSAQSKNFRDHVWLGQMLSAGHQAPQAEQEFRRAVELADTEAEAWAALIFHLARTDHKDQAEVALSQARQKLPQDQAALTLAQCYQAIGHQDQARELYQAALKAKPDDVATLRSVAGFCLANRESEEAKRHLNRILALKQNAPEDEDLQWAKHILAIMLSTTGNYQDVLKAQALMDIPEKGEAGRTSSEKADDLRVQALVLGTQKSLRQQKKAVALLEKMNGPTPDDRFLLARLYESVGDWPKAREQMARLAAAFPDRPEFVSTYARSLLLHGQTEDAQPWVKKLEGIPAMANTYELMEAQARLLAGQGKTDQAVALIAGFPDKQAKPPERADRLQLGAVLLDSLSQADQSAAKRFTEAAEVMYRELATAKPDRMLLLVGFLTRQGRIQEALDQCELAWQKCSTIAVANACMEIIQGRRAKPEQLERIDRWLQRAIAEQPKDNVTMTICLGNLRGIQNRPEEAEKLYEQALAKDSRNVMAMNNLGWLLKDKKGADALQQLNQAIEIAGPLPSLLDTRGMIHLTLGHADAAIEDLKSAMEELPRATSGFHLAQAYYAARNRPAAAEALAHATKTLGLQPERLDAVEKEAFERLNKELGHN